MLRSVRLSREEAWQALERAHTGIFTSLRRDGVPIALPVWFVVIDERIYLSGPAHRKKFARVRSDPRVSFLVESGERWAQLRGVHLTGHAHIVSDPDVRARVSDALQTKYDSFRTPRPTMPEVTRAVYETETATIEIVPDERILSWDNARFELAE